MVPTPLKTKNASSEPVQSAPLSSTALNDDAETRYRGGQPGTTPVTLRALFVSLLSVTTRPESAVAVTTT